MERFCKQVAILSMIVALAALSLLIAGCTTTCQKTEFKHKSNVYYIVESDKSFEQVSSDLPAAVKRHGFGVLHVHDIGSTLRSKGVSFDEQCKVFEVCNPKKAAKVLSTDMRMNMALPCRISVYTEGGKTKIGMILPKQMLSMLSTDPVLAEVAQEVEAKTMQMIDEAK